MKRRLEIKITGSVGMPIYKTAKMEKDAIRQIRKYLLHNLPNFISLQVELNEDTGEYFDDCTACVKYKVEVEEEQV